MKKLKIKYVDYLPNYNQEEAYFTTLLRKYYDVEISDNPDYIFYSVYSEKNEFENYDCIRIFYVLENISFNPVYRNTSYRPHVEANFKNCDYALGNDHMEFEDRYYRYPYYFICKDSLSLALKKHKINKVEIENKTKFCSFVYSHKLDTSKPREWFLNELSKYKKVDCGGKLFNNVGGPVKDKISFEKDYKFSIAFENDTTPGYTTEKIIDAFAAKTIPIYWGNPEIAKEFNSKAFINCHDFNNFDEVIEKIKQIDNDDDLYYEMLSQPIVNNPETFEEEHELKVMDFFRNIFNQPIEKAKKIKFSKEDKNVPIGPIKKELNIISNKDYCELMNYKFNIISEEFSQKTYYPNYFEKTDINNKYKELLYPECYISELKNVKIIGENSIIFDEKYCIYDMPFRDLDNRFRLEIRNVVRINNKNVLIKYEDKEEQNYIDKGIMLLSPISYNYFHFNVEIMTKLCMINNISKYNNIPLIVDKRVGDIPQLKEELEIINNNQREIIYVENGSLYNVGELINISDMMIFPFNLKKGEAYRYEDCIMNENALKLLQEKINTKSTPHKKLFLSRKQDEIKRLKNWQEVEQIFTNYSYEIIYPEAMSFKEQQEIFSQAKCIAGASGSGLVNIILSSTDCKLICIYPEEFKLNCYANLARVLGKEDYYIDAKVEQNKFGYEYNTGDFTVDIDYLLRFLTQLESIELNRKD